MLSTVFMMAEMFHSSPFPVCAAAGASHQNALCAFFGCNKFVGPTSFLTKHLEITLIVLGRLIHWLALALASNCVTYFGPPFILLTWERVLKTSAFPLLLLLLLCNCRSCLLLCFASVSHLMLCFHRLRFGQPTYWNLGYIDHGGASSGRATLWRSCEALGRGVHNNGGCILRNGTSCIVLSVVSLYKNVPFLINYTIRAFP